MDNLVLTDSAAVSRIFRPLSENAGTVAYADRDTNATVSGQGEVVIQYSRATPQRPTTRIVLRISDPKEELVDGHLKAIAVPRFIGEFIIPSEGIVKLDRENLLALVNSALSSLTMAGYVKDLAPVL